MRITTDDFANITTRRGLYRVWVRADEIEGAPLVARWIDSRAESLESRKQEPPCSERRARDVSLDLNLKIFCGMERL